MLGILAAAGRAGEAGAGAFLRKPLVGSTFVAAVRELEVASEVGTGPVFIARLPLIETPGTASAPSA